MNSQDKSVIGIEDEILNLIYSPEFLQNLNTSLNSKNRGIWNEKMSKKLIERYSIGVYSQKISSSIRHEIEDLNHLLDVDNDVYYFNEEFDYI